MKNKPLKGASKSKISGLNLKELKQIEKIINEQLRKLHIAARTNSKHQVKAINLLADFAYSFTFDIQSLYITPHTNDLLCSVANDRRKLSSTFDLDRPSGLRDNISLKKGFGLGDIFRSKLEYKYKENNLLKFNIKTEFDILRIIMEGFVRAVAKPPLKDKRFLEKSFSPSVIEKLNPHRKYEIQQFLEMAAAAEINEEIKKNLLSKTNRNNYKVWAREFVNWYKERHPWPFKDTRTGKDRLIHDGEQITDDIHMIAYEKLLFRRNSSPSEKSIWNALRVLVEARFKKSLNLTDISS